MYFDNAPCRVCGSEVRLEARTASSLPGESGPVGPEDGVVGGGDPTVDRRVCTNPDCPSYGAGDGDGAGDGAGDEDDMRV